MFTLSFLDAGMPRAHRLRDGVTLIGRAPTCDLVISAPLMSRQHARVRVEHGRVLLSDAGSTYGTLYGGAPLAGERELSPGDVFSVAQVEITLERDLPEDAVLSDQHQMLEESGTLFKPVGDTGAGAFTVAPAILQATPAPGANFDTRAATRLMPAAGAAGEDRRSGRDRRSVDLGRAGGDRRTVRDRRRNGRYLRLLSEITRAFLTVQPLEQVLTRIVDIAFEIVPAERAVLLLRDGVDAPLTARVLRRRDGTPAADVTISRTVVNRVIRERLAMVAKDALYDARLDASSSIQAMKIRSFVCAPLWNGHDVVGVLYCDSPRSQRFSADDLETFVALCNCAAGAIDQARLSAELVAETRRRERLLRHHSATAVSRLLHGGADALAPAARDVTALACDIVGLGSIAGEADTQSATDLLTRLFEGMSRASLDQAGTILGSADGTWLAVFGAPLDQADHASRAIAAALAMRREAARVSEAWHGQPLRVRMAVHSGRALAGEFGAPERSEFAVLGEAVETATELQRLIAGPGQIVISARTRAAIGDAFKVRPLGAVAPAGANRGLELFEVLD